MGIKKITADFTPDNVKIPMEVNHSKEKRDKKDSSYNLSESISINSHSSFSNSTE